LMRTAGISFKAPERLKKQNADGTDVKKSTAEPLLWIQLGKRQFSLSKSTVAVISVVIIVLSLILLNTILK